MILLQRSLLILKLNYGESHLDVASAENNLVRFTS